MAAFETLILGIIGGLASGVITSVLGYLKNQGQQFDWVELLTTMIIGAAIGGTGGYLGLTYDKAEIYLGSIGVLTIVQYVAKAVSRRLVPWFKELFNKTP